MIYTPLFFDYICTNLLLLFTIKTEKMNGKIPHIVQYQGSKRKLAPQILRYMPKKFSRLIEPFSGMAAISIAAAMAHRSDAYIINDLNKPLINILQEAIETPNQLICEYKKLWNDQFSYGNNHVQHYYDVRDRFNNGEQTPSNLLYLLARCVKGSVRYGASGKFNQSPDKRRHGTHPQTLEQNIYAISEVLKGKVEYYALDYHEILQMAKPGDLIYMDPPYQGVTATRDSRYFSGVPFAEFVDAIGSLNDNNVDFIVSYDGICGERQYGEKLPENLGCKKIFLNAGPSSQSTLLGKKENTFESLYISKSLTRLFYTAQKQLSVNEVAV